MALLIEAGQMTASDYVPTYPKLPLASEGASTEDLQLFTHKRQLARGGRSPGNCRAASTGFAPAADILRTTPYLP